MNPARPQAQAHADAGPTELAARRKAAPVAGKLRGQVLAAVVAAGDFGLTVPEALEGLNLPERKRYSLAPRLPELVRDGYVVKSLISRDGFAAYVATAAGIAWAEGSVAA
jgi:polyferredoxin